MTANHLTPREAPRRISQTGRPRRKAVTDSSCRVDAVVVEFEDEINDRCCHLVPHALSEATAISPYRDTGLCGYRPQLAPHDCGNPLALTCPGCGRPRCPECAIRYDRTRL